MKENKLLFKIILKNDYKTILFWLLTIIGISLVTASVYPQLYEDSQAIANYAVIMRNPAMNALLGAGGYKQDSFTHATIFSAEMLMFTAITVAIMNISFVHKFLKVPEESNLIEIINSKPVNRYSYLNTVYTIIILINLCIFVFLSLGLIIINIPGSTIKGSIFYGLSLTLVGLMFSSIAIIATKLFNDSSTSSVFSYLCLIIAYIIRALTDASNPNLSYLSPLGWLTKVLVFQDNKVLPILLLLILSIILYIIGFYSYKKTDNSSSLFIKRKVKNKASRLLKNDFGLIFRLERIQILVWITTLFFLTTAFGAIFEQFESFFEMEIIRQILGGKTEDLSKNLIFYIIKIISLFGIIPPLLIILKISKEESKRYLDNIYSRNTTRIRYIVPHILFALLLSLFIQVIIFFGVYIAGGDYVLNLMSLSALFIHCLSYLPAIWIILSLAVLFFSFGNKHSKYIWIYFSFIFISVYLENILNELMKNPKIILNLSSFYHVGNKINYISSLLMIFISLIGFLVGINLYKKRNIV